MKIAIACWNDRVAPIFDNAQQVHLVESESGKILSEQRILFQENTPIRNASLLSANGVSTLVCGAISRPIQKMVSDLGIHVIPFISGSLQEVVQAWLNNTPLEERFAMPGCCQRNRHRLGMGKTSGMEKGKGRGVGGKGRGLGGGRDLDAEAGSDTNKHFGRRRGNNNF